MIAKWAGHLLWIGSSMAVVLSLRADPAAVMPTTNAALQALRDPSAGHYILLRHAKTEPGTGDPDGFKLEDRSTQRNLSVEGIAQAQSLNRSLQSLRVPISQTWTSPWFRCQDTAAAIDGADQVVPAFGSFFRTDAETARQSVRAMREKLKPLPAGVNVLVVTHQVNITALTDVVPAMGEAVVVRVDADGTIRSMGAVDLIAAASVPTTSATSPGGFAYNAQQFTAEFAVLADIGPGSLSETTPATGPATMAFVRGPNPFQGVQNDCIYNTPATAPSTQPVN
jgi:broad specificity phosphatase PhoE